MSLTPPILTYCCLAPPEKTMIQAQRAAWLILPDFWLRSVADAVWEATGEPNPGARYDAYQQAYLLTPATIIIEEVEVEVFLFDTILMTGWDDYLATGPDCATKPCPPLHFTDI